MILLDTNVLSALMRPVPEQAVRAWLSAQPNEGVFISAVTEAELRYGLALMAEGKRRALLTEALETMLEEDFRSRILPFDRQAARAYAVLASGRRQAGRPISQADAQIAAIAKCRGAAVATRNVTDFEGCGIVVVNPWNQAIISTGWSG